MAEHVLLKTESVLLSPQKANAVQGHDPVTDKSKQDTNSFSAELDKHVQQAKPNSQSAAASKKMQPEKNAEPNGKKLPQKTDDGTDPAQAKQKSDSKTVKHDAASSSHSSKDQSAQSDQSKASDKSHSAEMVTSASQEVMNEHPVQVKHSKHEKRSTDTADTDSDETDSTGKVVVVDAHATEHAKTDKVTMQSREHQTKKDKTEATTDNQTEQPSSPAPEIVAQDQTTTDQKGKKKADTADSKVSEAVTSDTVNNTPVASVTNPDSKTTNASKTDLQSATDSAVDASTQTHSKSFTHRSLQPVSAGNAQTQQQNPVKDSDDKNVASTPNAALVVGEADKQVKKDANTADKPVVNLRPDIMHALTKQRVEGHHNNLASTDFKTAQKAMSEEISHIADLTRQGQTVPSEAATRVDPSTSPISQPLTATSTISSGTSTSAGIQSPVAAQQTTLDVQPNMQSAAWAKVMSSRVVWMAKQGVQKAQIKLNPAHLGPVEVRLHIHNDQASVTFVAHHAMTRDALEQALPKLRDSFVDNGLALANAEVSQQHHSGGQQPGAEGEQSGGHQNEISIQVNANEDDTLNDTGQMGENTSVAGLSLYA